MYWFNGSLSRLVALALLIVLALPVPSAQAQDDATWLYDQINGLRASLGLHGYAWNGALNAAAQAHSEWMAATGIISHEGEFDRGPGDRAVTFGYGGRSVTENIYGGGRANPQIAWNFWVNSGVHYAAIAHVNKNEIGIGVARGEGGTYYTLMFGQGSGVAAPAPPAQVPEEPVAPEIVPVAEAASQARRTPTTKRTCRATTAHPSANYVHAVTDSSFANAHNNLDAHLHLDALTNGQHPAANRDAHPVSDGHSAADRHRDCAGGIPHPDCAATFASGSARRRSARARGGTRGG